MDVKRISGVAVDASGNAYGVAINVLEKETEIVDSIDMEIELRWACESNGLRLIEVTQIDYVDAGVCQ